MQNAFVADRESTRPFQSQTKPKGPASCRLSTHACAHTRVHTRTLIHKGFKMDPKCALLLPAHMICGPEIHPEANLGTQLVTAQIT